MASYKGHLLGGSIAYAVGLLLLTALGGSAAATLAEWGYWFLATMVGSLIPDCDISSKGQRLWYGIVLIGAVMLLFAQQYRMLAYAAPLIIIPLLIGHRTWSHTLTFWSVYTATIIGALSYLASRSLYTYIPCSSRLLFFFCCGILSHLLLDGYPAGRNPRLRRWGNRVFK